MTTLPYSNENLVREDKGFGKHDIFGYANFGQELQELVAPISKKGDGRRIAIDGDWGCGKTVFLEMWQEHMEEQGFTVIYYDAFKSDCQDDVFFTFSKVIYQELGEKNKLKFKRIIKQNIHHFTKSLAAKIDGGMISGGIINEIFNRWDDEENNSYDNFTEALKKLINNQCKEKPLIFIIDELDRCKPYFALELLEKIKHAFNLPNLHFVFALNINALANLVRKAYGLDRRYLDKFFKLVTPIPKRTIYIPESDRDYVDYSNTLEESVEIYINLFFKNLISTCNFAKNSASLCTETYKKISQHKIKENKPFSIRDFQRMHDYFISNLSKIIKIEDDESYKYYVLSKLYFIRMEKPDYFEDFNNFIYKTGDKQAETLTDCFDYLRKNNIMMAHLNDYEHKPEDWQEDPYFKTLWGIIDNIS